MTDDEIRDGIRLLAETTGIFTETAGGVTTAVLAKLAERGDIDPDERVVVYITGEGLKTLDAIREGFRCTRSSRRSSRSRQSRAGALSRALGPTSNEPAMAVTVKIPAQLRGGDRRRGRDRGRRRDRRRGARRGLRPARDLRERITEDGGLRRFVNVYVSGEDIRFQDGPRDRRSPTATR